MVFVGFAGHDVCHIQALAIRRTHNAVWFNEVTGHGYGCPFSFGQEIYFFTGYFRAVSFPIGPLVIGVGEIDVALAINPQIVGTVEVLAII